MAFEGWLCPVEANGNPLMHPHDGVSTHRAG